MELNLPYFVYCEGASWFLLEQPLNVLSHVAFFICAVMIWLNDQGRGSSLSLLAALLAICGLTGMAWHASEVQIALALDLAAQITLVGVLTTVLANQILGWTPLNSVIVSIIMVLLTLLGRNLGLPFLLQNGGAFLPIMIFLVLLGFNRIQNGHPRPAKYLIASAYTLFIAMILHSLDWVVCTEFSLGTHWAWQVGIAITAYLAIEAVHKNREELESTQA